jgi:hypothetical protein
MLTDCWPPGSVPAGPGRKGVAVTPGGDVVEIGDLNQTITLGSTTLMGPPSSGMLQPYVVKFSGLAGC